jgi:hypothetical protein
MKGIWEEDSQKSPRRTYRTLSRPFIEDAFGEANRAIPLKNPRKWIDGKANKGLGTKPS